MATLRKPLSNTAEHDTQGKEISNEAFSPEDTLDQPCDVILVVQDGKELKAHRQVLSEASSFFEKLFNSAMKESEEGIVKLQMFSVSLMRSTLEFIYIGHVQILTEDNARDLIVIADYLFLQNLKTLAEEVLLCYLKTSNCISSYYFSERYKCTELSSKAMEFILANFTAVFAANQEETLHMSNEQLKIWISSDEININAEEDVFKIILAWIDHDKSQRKKYFAELFRQVRLVYVSRDYLCSDVVTSDLVKESEECVDLVADATRVIESKNYDNLPILPRKSLTTPVLVIICSLLSQDNIHCYFPRENRWHGLGRIFPFGDDGYVVSCRGKIYCIKIPSWHARESHGWRMRSYNPYSNNWESLTVNEDRDVRQIFVGNDEIYSLVSEPCAECCRCSTLAEHPFGRRNAVCDKGKHVFFIAKYKPESNSWEDILSFDHLNSRPNFCIVANDNFVYFIGREDNYVERYDLRKNHWQKVADTKTRGCFTGAAVNGKLVITDGVDRMARLQCEMFNEPTNEWQFIPRFDTHPHWNYKLVSVDGMLYVLATQNLQDREVRVSIPYQGKVECYDSDKNQWNQKTKIPANIPYVQHACSMRIFKRFLLNEEKERMQRKCFIL